MGDRPVTGELGQKVFEALGAASVCWQHVGNAGEFDSSAAAAIGDELVDYVYYLLFRYSEWLDADQGLIVGEDMSGDERSHEELVKDFLASRA